MVDVAFLASSTRLVVYARRVGYGERVPCVEFSIDRVSKALQPVPQQDTSVGTVLAEKFGMDQPCAMDDSTGPPSSQESVLM